MRTNVILILGVVLGALVYIPIDAKRYSLRPLSAREVYKILRDGGREDAIPEGRVITQGIAAIKGFALGVTKGIGGSLIFDLVTSNATIDLLSGLNVTGLMSNLPTLNFSAIQLPQLFNWSSGNNVAIQYTNQEICFSSRSARSLTDEIPTEEDDQIQTKIAGTGTGTGTGTGIGTGTVTVGDARQAATATATATNTGTGTATNTNTGTGTVTNSATTTVENPVKTTCVVVKKPVSYRRKRSLNNGQRQQKIVKKLRKIQRKR